PPSRDDRKTTTVPPRARPTATPAPDGSPASLKVSERPRLFEPFAGTGADGDRTVSGAEKLGSARREYNNLTIHPGAVLSADKSWAFIAVKGMCNIGGTVMADGQGARGGAGGSARGGERGEDGARVTHGPKAASAEGSGGA